MPPDIQIPSVLMPLSVPLNIRVLSLVMKSPAVPLSVVIAVSEAFFGGANTPA
jgi:hypothetical protein